MKRLTLAATAFLAVLVLGPWCATHAADASLMAIPVDSPALVFSPGNWTGDVGRAGKVFRQTWNPGAYFRVTWASKNPKPVAKILLDTSTYSAALKPPQIAYSIDGVWKSKIPCASEVVIDLGPGVAKNLGTKNGVMGGLHPNDRGHANFAATIIPQVMKIIGGL
ncbi:MAG: hypothetical protein A3K19_19905 [Lentisphaerae bacterium RIFOXYB12_FULL_65_16]|nr:MAG: hypothetical protein A3K18_07185 [Lentisphaerae bacterium RIFOXYA12_64_32]OGV85075.1 MAG: hypothetical protein A3K19_19905 [Lentisphaerae bacterium RIFOXYB12_FULL_65_16]